MRLHFSLPFSIIFLLAVLLSCVHENSLPDSPSLNHWTKEVQDKSVNLGYFSWWKQFNNPVLENLISQTVSHNLSIKIAQENLKTATGQLNTVKLSWLPSLNLMGGYIGSSSNTAIAPIGNLGILSGSGGFIGILPNYLVNILANYSLQQQAQHQQNIAKARIMAVRLAVVSQIVSAYFVLLAWNDVHKKYESLNNSISALKTLNQNMQNRGMASQISMDDLSHYQELILGQLTLVNKNIAASQNAIKQLIGEAPGTFKNQSTFSKINSNQIIPGNLPMDVIAHRPDIVIAAEEYQMANNGIGVAASALFPIVSANAFYAKTSATVTAFSGNANTTAHTSQNYYTGYLSWILSPAIFGQIQTAKGIKAAAAVSYQQTVLAALHDVDNALSAHDGYSAKFQHDENALTHTKHANTLKRALYKQGLNTKSELLLAQIHQNTLEIEIIQSKLQKLISLVAVYQSMGGGYKLNVLSDEQIESQS